jgi:hypothetical protein
MNTRRGLGVATVAAVLGLSGWAWSTYAAAASNPVAELSIEAASQPLSVILVANSSGFPSPVVSYRWHFGDGTSATTRQPRVTHTFPVTGRFAPKLTESDANGDQASAHGVLELFSCPAGSSCTETMSRVAGVKTLSPSGPIAPAANATVDLFVGPYQIANCQAAVATDGALTDSGFSGDLEVRVVYAAQDPSVVPITCFSSVVPFVDSQGQTVNNGPLPMCSTAGAAPPCVESITTKPTPSGLQATKTIVIPPGDPKVGAL